MLRTLLAIAFVVLFSNLLSAQDPTQVFEAKTFTSGEKTLRYRFLSPENVSPFDCKQLPLVIFLHGAGERGDDNTKQLVHGMKEFITPVNREKFPCYVIAPQCPSGQKWVEVDWGADTHQTPAQPSEPLGLTFELVDQMLEELLIDRNRIYITGLSMGGYGTWDALVRRPKFFAAGLPICGGGDESMASKLVGIPIWAFHGDKDTAVKPIRSTNMIEAIKEAGGSAKLTMYPSVGHNSWTQTYADPTVLEWLFDQSKE